MGDVLKSIITSQEPKIRNQSLDTICRSLSLNELNNECQTLDRFRRDSDNLYEKVRALFFLYAIHRFHIPFQKEIREKGTIPFPGYVNILKRRFEEAIDVFLKEQQNQGPNCGISTALSAAYQKLAFQTLANQVRKSVRSFLGNQWMFRIGHPLDHPLRIHKTLQNCDQTGLFPILKESTPVRMDLSHSGWSDIFFLGMDFPEGANVLNVSINLSANESGRKEVPKPPVEAYLRIIDEPIIRLSSVDLGVSSEIDSFSEVFDFAKDYLGLLKAAVIASGIVPPGMEGADQPLSDLLARLIKPGYGLEIVSCVNDIPKGSRLAVSTNLLASLIAVCMRATGQIQTLTGSLTESERRLVAARAILGEWLGGSGGGWQDSGGVWPGMKIINGVLASEGDPEFGISRGCLLPKHKILTQEEISLETRQKLQDSLILVHGGMAQDVGPILEMVTEKYLLRSEDEWHGRLKAIDLLDAIQSNLKRGDIKSVGEKTQQNFFGPIQTIIPWATNLFTESIISQMDKKYSKDFYGFWMLGGMAGGGMGFMVDPSQKQGAQLYIEQIMRSTKKELDQAVPFAIEPIVYDFSINEHGTMSKLLANGEALMPSGYYTQIIPSLLRQEVKHLSRNRRSELEYFSVACRSDNAFSNSIKDLFDHMVPHTEAIGTNDNPLEYFLNEYGFDSVQHEKIRNELQTGRIGIAQNRLPVSGNIEDVFTDDVYDPSIQKVNEYHKIGEDALKKGQVAVVSLAGGAGSRWTHGAGVVKAINPFCKFSGHHRSFVETHLAKSENTFRKYGRPVQHVITTSYLTHQPIKSCLERQNNYRYKGPLYLSLGQSIGLRLIPMARDLRFTWEETPQQLLDEQAQKMQESIHSALINWAESAGEGSDYLDNKPLQCLHSVGHWYEIPNLVRNGILLKMLKDNPGLKYLMMHNIDTVGTNLQPEYLGYHIASDSDLTFEVMSRQFEDRGGGLARYNGRLQLIEGLALPNEEIEFNLSYYNTNTTWISIDRLLALFKLSVADLDNQEKIKSAIRLVASKMPTYIIIKDVKKRWGKGQEDIYPVTQFEKLWVDMTGLVDVKSSFVTVPRIRGQQLKEPAQLDGWLRDGSASYVDSLCDWS
jgi:hypothetical protein